MKNCIVNYSGVTNGATYCATAVDTINISPRDPQARDPLSPDPSHYHALVIALRIAMSLPRDELHAMGIRGRDWMQRDFSWDRIARDMLDVYLWLKVGGEPPATVRLG